MKLLSSLLIALVLIGCEKKHQADEFSLGVGIDRPCFGYMHDDDFSFLERAKSTFYKNAHLLDKSYKIPPVVHVIWLGPRPFPIDSMKNIISWQKYHPDWSIKLWTDRPRALPLKVQEIDVETFAFQKLKKYFDESDNYGEKSDILRYEILSKEGGVYIDHDALCLRSFESFHKSYDFYGGFELPHPEIDGHCLTLGIGIIGAIPNHPLINNAMEQIDKRWDKITKKFSTHDNLTNAEKVMHRTYIALTLSAFEEFGKTSYRDIIFPANYFFATSGLEPFYSKHLYATSWNFYSEKNTPKFVHAKLKSPMKKQKRAYNFLMLYAVIMITLLSYLAYRARKT